MHEAVPSCSRATNGASAALRPRADVKDKAWIIKTPAPLRKAAINRGTANIMQKAVAKTPLAKAKGKPNFWRE
jgi:hypothetical protein